MIERKKNNREKKKRKRKKKKVTLNGVIDGEDVDALSVLDVGALVDRDDVTEANTKVAPDNLASKIRREGMGKERRKTRHKVG